MRWLALFITVPLTIFAVVFAVSNTAKVDVRLILVDMDFTMPLYLVGLGMMGAGFFLGALFVWLHSQKTRFKYWRETRRADRLEKEIDSLREEKILAPPREGEAPSG